MTFRRLHAAVAAASLCIAVPSAALAGKREKGGEKREKQEKSEKQDKHEAHEKEEAHEKHDKGAPSVERGKYLVQHVARCIDCHTAMGPNGPDVAHDLQGADLPFKPTIEMPWATRTPSIAGLPKGYDEAALVKLLTTGKRADGSRLLPPMPGYDLEERDAADIAAYLASLPKAP